MGPSGGPLIAGGTTGQALVKKSDADYDATWGSAGSGILTGLGPPANAVGTVGAYYVDLDTGNMYGPKNPPGTYGPARSAYRNLGGYVYSSHTYEQSVGMTFVPLVDGRVTGLRLYRHASEELSNRTLKIHGAAGAVLGTTAPIAADTGAFTGWIDVPLPSPVPITTGVQFTVAANRGDYVDFTGVANVLLPVGVSADYVRYSTGRYSWTYDSYPTSVTQSNYAVDFLAEFIEPVWPLTIHDKVDATPNGDTMLGDLKLTNSGGSGTSVVIENPTDSTYGGVVWMNNGKRRWRLAAYRGGEIGSNAGSDMYMERFQDDGAAFSGQTGTMFNFNRKTGLITSYSGGTSQISFSDTGWNTWMSLSWVTSDTTWTWVYLGVKRCVNTVEMFGRVNRKAGVTGGNYNAWQVLIAGANIPSGFRNTKVGPVALATMDSPMAMGVISQGRTGQPSYTLQIQFPYLAGTWAGTETEIQFHVMYQTADNWPSTIPGVPG